MLVRNAIDLKAAIWRDGARRIRSLDRQTRESCIMFERMAMRRPNPLAPNRDKALDKSGPQAIITYSRQCDRGIL